MCQRDLPCKYHKHENNKIIINNVDKCQHIIKSGFDIGKACERDLPCKYHKNKVINKVPSLEDNIINNNDEEDLIEV